MVMSMSPNPVSIGDYVRVSCYADETCGYAILLPPPEVVDLHPLSNGWTGWDLVIGPITPVYYGRFDCEDVMNYVVRSVTLKVFSSKFIGVYMYILGALNYMLYPLLLLRITIILLRNAKHA